MTNIYDLHDKAFSNVQAFVIAKDSERVATVAFKYPKDGAGRLYCYLHILGFPMVRACASGYGYDKRSAAAAAAAKLVDLSGDHSLARKELAQTIKSLITDGGHSWERPLQDAGFNVWQAV